MTKNVILILDERSNAEYYQTMKNTFWNFARIGALTFIIVSCSDMGEPEILLPQIDVDVTGIDFSSITINTEQTQTFNITNLGDGELSGALALIQDSSIYSLVPSGAFSLAANDTLSVELSFRPLGDVSYGAEVLITSNDPSISEISIDVLGQGTSLPVPVLSLSSSQMTFGTLLSSATAQKQFTISNTGTDTLVISSISISLNVYQTDAVLPLSLNPGESQIVTITFQPGAVGTFDTNLTLVSNSAGSPHQISISGSGEAAVSYASSVQPVWNASCIGCHPSSAGLDLTSYANLMSGSVVIAGDGANSKIIKKLKGTSGSQMPLSGTPLSAGTISTIESWINQGALDN